MRLRIRALAVVAITASLAAATVSPANAIDNKNTCSTTSYNITSNSRIVVQACVAFSNSGANVQFYSHAYQTQIPGVPFIVDRTSLFRVIGQLRYSGGLLRTDCYTDAPSTGYSDGGDATCEGAWPRGTQVYWYATGFLRYTDSTGTHYGDLDGHVVTTASIYG